MSIRAKSLGRVAVWNFERDGSDAEGLCLEFWGGGAGGDRKKVRLTLNQHAMVRLVSEFALYAKERREEAERFEAFIRKAGGAA